MIQPAHVSVFRFFKANWKSTIREWRSKPENVNKCLTKVTFTPLLAETVAKSSMTEAIKNGFRACGLYPFDPNAVDYTKCVQNDLENLNECSSPVIPDDLDGLERAVKSIAPNLTKRDVDVDIFLEVIQKAKSGESTIQEGYRIPNQHCRIEEKGKYKLKFKN